MADHITLDRDTFKALASDTRLDLLKALDVRQKTVTELAKELDLNKATVFEHLEKLSEVGLVQKLEDERKWVYYQLTWKGRRLLHPEKITIALLLSGSAAAFITGVVTLWLWVHSTVQKATSFESGAGALTEGDSSARSAAAAEPMAEKSDLAAGAPPSTDAAAGVQDGVLLGVAIALLVLFVAFVAFALWRAKKAKNDPIST